MISNANHLSHSPPLFINLKILNVYQINIYHHLIFIYKINNDTMPNIFKTLYKKYSTNTLQDMQTIIIFKPKLTLKPLSFLSQLEAPNYGV